MKNRPMSGRSKSKKPRGVVGSSDSGRFAYDGLNRILHEKARLGILTSLLGRSDGILFNELKDLCALTDGNLSRHLRILNEAGLIEIWKGQTRNRRTQTMCRLTAPGRTRFVAYLSELEKVLRDARGAARTARRSSHKKSMPISRSKMAPAGWAPA